MTFETLIDGKAPTLLGMGTLCDWQFKACFTEWRPICCGEDEGFIRKGKSQSIANGNISSTYSQRESAFPAGSFKHVVGEYFIQSRVAGE